MHVNSYNYKGFIMAGERMGLKALIEHYEMLLEKGIIKQGGPAHERLNELRDKLKKKRLNTYYGRSLTTKHRS